MKNIVISLIIVLLSTFWSCQANADIDVAAEYKETIGRYIQVYQPDDVDLRMQDALLAYRNGRFSPSGNSVLNFGIGAKPVWLAFKETLNKLLHDL